MKTITAMNIIQKEARFLGIGIVDVMKEVEKHGCLLYSERVVQAVKVIANN